MKHINRSELIKSIFKFKKNAVKRKMQIFHQINTARALEKKNNIKFAFEQYKFEGFYL